MKYAYGLCIMIIFLFCFDYINIKITCINTKALNKKLSFQQIDMINQTIPKYQASKNKHVQPTKFSEMNRKRIPVHLMQYFSNQELVNITYSKGIYNDISIYLLNNTSKNHTQCWLNAGLKPPSKKASFSDFIRKQKNNHKVNYNKTTIQIGNKVVNITLPEGSYLKKSDIYSYDVMEEKYKAFWEIIYKYTIFDFSSWNTTDVIRVEQWISTYFEKSAISDICSNCIDNIDELSYIQDTIKEINSTLKLVLSSVQSDLANTLPMFLDAINDLKRNMTQIRIRILLMKTLECDDFSTNNKWLKGIDNELNEIVEVIESRIHQLNFNSHFLILAH